MRYEKMIEQLQSERDAKVADVKSKLAMISKLFEFENQHMASVPPATAPPASPRPPLADFFVRRLSEMGPTSRDDLRNLAVKGGYFADLESAAPSVDTILEEIVGKNRIVQLPNEIFAPPPLSQMIGFRRVT
jgi:hypothetical protein